MFDDFDFDTITSFDENDDFDEPSGNLSGGAAFGDGQIDFYQGNYNVFENNIFGSENPMNINSFDNSEYVDVDTSTSSTPNIFGGQDIYEDGVRTGFTQPNIFGGANLVEDGVVTASSTPNIFGGQDIYEDGVRTGFTQPNIFGGQDIFENGVKIGCTVPNIFGKK